MEIIVTIEGTHYRAELPDSDSIQQLSEQFPLEETFQKSGEHELFCRLGRGINVRGMDGTSDIHRNGIYYFADWKALSLVYKDMSISPYQVVCLGEFSDDVCDVFSRAGNKVKVRLEEKHNEERCNDCNRCRSDRHGNCPKSRIRKEDRTR